MMEPAHDVEARFADDGQITVRRFTYRGQRQIVASQGRQWQAADGRHVLVMTVNERTIELVYDGEGWHIAGRAGGGATTVA